MTEIGVHEAKTHLSRPLRRVAQGEEIVITSSGRPVAMLVPIRGVSPRRFGIDEGTLQVPGDFDAALPDDVLQAFDR